MTCKELIMSIVDADGQNGYSMEIDDPRKLIAIAYYMGRESAARYVSNQYNKLLTQQLQRAADCRYHNMALSIQGDVKYIYSTDYIGDMTAMFGADQTAQTVDSLKK
nr:MAG TPA: hypothetical protein [Caudoviricetes sp.]